MSFAFRALLVLFAVVLGFTAALVALGNYPHPVTVHGAAPKALPRFTDGLRPAGDYVHFLDISAVVCANCHSNINFHDSFANAEGDCESCHDKGGYGMEVSATVAYHTSIKSLNDQCSSCHDPGGAGGQQLANLAYHIPPLN